MIVNIIGDPTTQFDTNPQYQLGTEGRYLYQTGGGSTAYWWAMRYVLFKDAVTYAAGQVVSPGTTFGWVTNDVSGGSSLVLRCAGVVVGVAETGKYGWVLTEGYWPTVKTNGDDDIAAGDTIIMVATDGVVDSVAAATTTGTLLYVGTAQAADVDADNTVAVIVKSPIW